MLPERCLESLRRWRYKEAPVRVRSEFRWLCGGSDHEDGYSLGVSPRCEAIALRSSRLRQCQSRKMKHAEGGVLVQEPIRSALPRRIGQPIGLALPDLSRGKPAAPFFHTGPVRSLEFHARSLQMIR